MKRYPIVAVALVAMIIGLSLKAFSIPQMSAQQSTSSTGRQDVLVEMITTEGSVILRLFGDTPRHQENFLKLVGEGYYDGMLFHRVIKDFMVQTGDPDSKSATAGQLLGMGGPGYEIDAEIEFPRHYNRRGALAAARKGDAVNPLCRSNGSQFYIVTGRKFTSSDLDKLEMNLIRTQKQAIANQLMAKHHDEIMSLRRSRDREGLQLLQDSLNAEARKIASAMQLGYTQEQMRDYATVGGAPHLDASYTVFGQVESGYDVIERIQERPVDGNSRPTEDVKVLSMKIVESK